jgi:hypothetical protein
LHLCCVINNRIISTDSTQKTYIDTINTNLNNRITSTDSTQKTYIDTADSNLDTRISYVTGFLQDSIDEKVEEVRVKETALCYVHQSSNNTQTVPNNAITRVFFTTALYNTFGRYDFGEYRFTPTLYAGFYQLNTSVCLPNINTGYIAFFRNGQEYSRGSSFSSSLTYADTALTASTIMYFNGSNVGSYVRVAK